MLSKLFGTAQSQVRRAFERAAKQAPQGPLSDYYAAGLASFDTPACEAELLAIDLETDGLDSSRDAILEAGMVELSGTLVRSSSAMRVRFRSESRLNPAAVAIHRIMDDAAASALPASDALAAVLGRCAGKVLVAHFAEIEAGFLDSACRRLFGAPFVAPFICTMQLEARWFPRSRAQDGLRLGKLRSQYQLPTYHAHDGLTDALGCAELLLAQLSHAGRTSAAIGSLLRH